MWLFKITTLCTISLNGLLVPWYIISNYLDTIDPLNAGLRHMIFLIMSYAAVISLGFFACLAAVRIRSGYKGTRLMIGTRHLHEGTIGIGLVLIGIVWNIWHFFDPNFHFPWGKFATIGWYLAVGGLIWIVIGAVLIGRDWEDVKHGKFFNQEDD
ncbi:MAG: hypothetical protein EU536_03140 [Promethearchaeota archaeon]|nr:MAG: hypothetical protein EU536_03140 [Candidatus Lokiarchaeota archaeon]